MEIDTLLINFINSIHPTWSTNIYLHGVVMCCAAVTKCVLTHNYVIQRTNDKGCGYSKKITSDICHSYVIYLMPDVECPRFIAAIQKL